MDLTRKIIVDDSYKGFDYQKIGANSSYEIINGVLTTTSVLNEPGWVQFMIETQKNCIVEVTCEAKLNLGRARIGLSKEVASNPNKPEGNATTSLDYVDIVSPDWKPYTIRFPYKESEPYAYATFGHWGDMEGSASFRNITVKVYNGELNKYEDKTRFGLLRGGQTGTGAWQIHPEYANKGLISVSADSQKLTLTFDEYKTKLKPSIQVSTFLSLVTQIM